MKGTLILDWLIAPRGSLMKRDGRPCIAPGGSAFLVFSADPSPDDVGLDYMLNLIHDD